MSNETCQLYGSYSNCTACFLGCKPQGAFDLAIFRNITQCIIQCASPSDVLNTSAITYDTCKALAGTGSWSLYHLGDIWARLTTWKFPLLQLIAIFPRPPLNWSGEVFAIVHLLGDPIGTIANLILKVRSNHIRALYWKSRIQESVLDTLISDEVLEGGRQPNRSTRYTASTRLWKRLAIIVDSYDEWGLETGDRVQRALSRVLFLSDDGLSEDDKADFLLQKRLLLEKCHGTAKMLAADRTTKFLPIVVAQLFFAGTIGLALSRIQDTAFGSTPSTFANIDSHSIAYSMLYFWILLAVSLAATIGVSQSADAIPRILMRFKIDAGTVYPELCQDLPSVTLDDTATRRSLGGLYSWLVPEARDRLVARTRDQELPDEGNKSLLRKIWQSFASGVNRLGDSATLIGAATVLLCGAISVSISWRVPPEGFGCRGFSEVIISIVWLSSAVLNAVNLTNTTAQFYCTLAKDLVSMIVTLGWTFLTMVGIYNKCSCYDLGGSAGLALPGFPDVREILMERTRREFPISIGVWTGVLLVIVPVILSGRYASAVRVFLQRDDDDSNAWDWVHWMWSPVVRGCRAVRRTLRRIFGRQAGEVSNPLQRSRTSRVVGAQWVTILARSSHRTSTDERPAKEVSPRRNSSDSGSQLLEVWGLADPSRGTEGQLRKRPTS